MTKEKRTFAKIQDELTRWQELRQQLEAVESDPAALLDTLDGETELTDVLLLLSDEIAERQAMAQAVKERIAEMQARKSRLDASAETLRNVIIMAMERAGLEKITADFCTLSVGKVARKMEIVEESEIPARFWTTQPPKLDRQALTAALKDGEAVAGARLDNGGINLTIRRK